MRIKKIILQVEEYSSLDELPAVDRELMEQATSARSTAYSPYSRFEVGAAVKLTNGAVITGSNQENAAYPSGLCAERVALFHAQSLYPEAAVETIAITAASRDFKMTEPVSPCGSCRQVMAEYENRHHHNIRVIMGSNDGKFWAVNSIDNLLPLMFMLEQLKKEKR
jgi:cytidine deaminase